MRARVAVIVLAFALVCSADAFALSVVSNGLLSNGAVHVSGGGKVLSGTLGQPVIGIQAGASYINHIGFWYLFGPKHPVGVSQPADRPIAFNLSQNHPNPFTRTTTIRFAVPKTGPVSLCIFDVVGRHIVTLVDDTLEPGRYSVVFRAHGMRTGSYWYRLVGDGFTDTKHFVLLK